jgi:CRP-like cAMP-binding protein
MTELLDFLGSLHPLSDQLTERLQLIVTEQEIARKKFLLKVGRICNNIYFVKKGIFRAYYNKTGKDISHGFMKEGRICVDLESYNKRSYSNMNIQALEDSIVQYIPSEQLKKAMEDYPLLNQIGRILTEKCLLQEIGRMKGTWMLKAEDRFRWLMQHSPDLIKRVPGKYLASFIGMTEEMFSRLKQKGHD